jgi:hypothetical protein
MPTRLKDLRFTVSGGFTKFDRSQVACPHKPTALGVTQSIESGVPKGTRMILLREPISGALYPPLREVTFDKKNLTALPLKQKFWCYADGYMYEWNSPSGISELAWFQTERSTSGIQYPTQASKDRALTMALSRVADSPFMGAVDLGEIKETLQFLKRPFGGLSDLMRGYHRKVQYDLESKLKVVTPARKRYRAKSTVRTDMNKWRSDIAADTWLEYRYAASPLVLSASSLAETAATQVTDLLGKVHSARGAHKTLSVTTEEYGVDWVLDGCSSAGARRRANVYRSTEVKAAYVIRYIYRPWMVDAINLARYGISPTQILSTGYELLRLSWMADWFWNMGTWLKAMEPKPQVQILDTCYTHKYVSQVDVQDNGGTWSYYGMCLPAVKDCWSSFKREYMRRSIVTDNLQAPTPRITADYVTVSRILDAVSILWRPAATIARRYYNK